MTNQEAITILQPIKNGIMHKRYIESLSLAIAALKQQKDNSWEKVEKKLPTLPDCDYCHTVVIAACGKTVMPMIYERTLKRGQRTERWKYYWDKIADEPVTHWMPLPAHPTQNQ